MKKVILTCAILVAMILSGCGRTGSITQSKPEYSTVVSSEVSATESTTVNSAISAANDSAPVSVNSENAVAAEKNPPGDIPDTQVFVKYTSTLGGYELQVPEGWARTENGSAVSFADKYDGVKVTVSDSAYPLSVDSINQNYIPSFKKTGRAISITSVKEAKLKGGTAIVLAYSSNSEPDTVTNKQIRLENTSYFFIRNGKMAVMTVWAPLGADNVDQWNLMSNSFQWK